MLNEVKRLCKNDFSNIVKEYQVVQYSFPGIKEVIAKFNQMTEAVEFIKNNQDINNVCIYSFLTLETKKYNEKEEITKW